MSVLSSWLATSAAWMLMWMVEQISHPGRREECAALLRGQRLQLLGPKVECNLSFSNPLVGGGKRSSIKIFFISYTLYMSLYSEKYTACDVGMVVSQKHFLVVYILSLLTCFFSPSFFYLYQLL